MHPLTEGVTVVVTPSAPWWRYMPLSIDQQLGPGRAGRADCAELKLWRLRGYREGCRQEKEART